MGAFTKTLLILLLAVSVPILYRQFANDKTIKFMSSYYSDYKSIDQFLRQSASHLDRAKDYVTDSSQIRGLVDKVQQQVNSIIDSTKSGSTTEHKTKKTKETTTAKEASTVKYTSCPGEDLGGKKVRLWTKEELVKYDGNVEEPKVYLAFLGIVYDVSVNAQHYAKGAEYNAFAGKDATRAFVTGNFTHDLHDDIRDIEKSLYSHIESWVSFYNSSYANLGRLIGSFYDSRGCSTSELGRVYSVIEQLHEDKTKASQQEIVLPECNSEWNSDTKQSRVWCSTKSGGVERDWVGVPRVYNDGQSNRCACFNLQGAEDNELAKSLALYPGCDPQAFECILKQ